MLAQDERGQPLGIAPFHIARPPKLAGTVAFVDAAVWNPCTRTKGTTMKKKTLALALAFGLAAALGRTLLAQDSRPTEGEEPQTCHLAPAKGGTGEAPFR